MEVVGPSIADLPGPDPRMPLDLGNGMGVSLNLLRCWHPTLCLSQVIGPAHFHGCQTPEASQCQKSCVWVGAGLGQSTCLKDCVSML